MTCRDCAAAFATAQDLPYQFSGVAGTKMEKTANALDIPFWTEMYADAKDSKDGVLVIDRKKKI
ncbi:hypothetical protein GJ744_012010 [Endocarpon pusillum]|uniref:Uncharacterized protein n=1 Tax=Endocarpon pusillum TaxID=364733 RepID=A0A8H7E899_9EURO|nr:hypothetical protein GJ744_012010 [Endocarpon pusillum]